MAEQRLVMTKIDDMLAVVAQFMGGTISPAARALTIELDPISRQLAIVYVDPLSEDKRLDLMAKFELTRIFGGSNAQQ